MPHNNESPRSLADFLRNNEDEVYYREFSEPQYDYEETEPEDIPWHLINPLRVLYQAREQEIKAHQLRIEQQRQKREQDAMNELHRILDKLEAQPPSLNTEQDSSTEDSFFFLQPEQLQLNFDHFEDQHQHTNESIQTSPHKPHIQKRPRDSMQDSDSPRTKNSSLSL